VCVCGRGCVRCTSVDVCVSWAPTRCLTKGPKRPGHDANVTSRARPVRVVARSGLSAARHMSAFG